MAELLIVDADGFSDQDYANVNSALGINMETGQGDWPPGLLSHAGGSTSTGWRVVEVWESRHQQEDFLTSRLIPAFQAAGVQGQPGMSWLSLSAYTTPSS